MKTVKKTLARKLILIIFCSLSLVTVQAQDSKTIDLTVPGTLRDSLSTEEKNSLIRLTVTGTIDARDFRTMRDEMPLLAEVDLSDVEITAYEGNEGTLLYNTRSYPANEIPFWAFHDGYTGIGKTSLTTFIYPSSTVSVGKEAFSDCYGLTSVLLPASVKTIGAGAYMYCAKLGTLILPEGVQTIGEGAFKYCISLESVAIPSTVRVVEKRTFESCERLSSLELSEGVQSIGEGAFLQCVLLESVTIPSSVITIGDNAFSLCFSLKEVVLFEGVQSIGNYVFSNCTALGSVIIPSSMISIGSYAFENCEQLESVQLPEGMTTLGAKAFQNCIRLTTINIPSSIKSIQYYTFYNCENLISVIIPEGVQSIEQGAFSDCSQLKTVTIPSTVTSIGQSAFMSCESLERIFIPGKLGLIGDYAFYNCLRLRSVNIPSTVKSIGNYAFFYCLEMKSIVSESIIPLDISIPQEVFVGIDKVTCILSVPSGSKELYAKADKWKDFIFIEESTEPIVYPDIIADKGAPSSILDLKDLYNDASITGYTVTSNTNPQVVTADITGSSMTLNFSAETTGISELIVTATSNGKEAQLILKVEVKLPTGLSDLEEQQVISVYPNPTRGAVNVKMNGLGAKGKRYRVSDASGRMIYRSVISNEVETFNLKGNPSGMYFLKIEGEVKELYKIILE